MHKEMHLNQCCKTTKINENREIFLSIQDNYKNESMNEFGSLLKIKRMTEYYLS